MAFFRLHEVVIEVGVELFCDSKGSFYEWVVIFSGKSSSRLSRGLVVSRCETQRANHMDRWDTGT